MAVSQLRSGKTYDPHINTIVAIIATRERGQLVTYVELETATGLNRHSDKNIWGVIITKVKKKVLEGRGIALQTANNVGYKLPTQEEQLLNQKREKSAARQIRQSCTEKALIRPEELTPEQQAYQLAVVHQAQMAGDHLRRLGAERKSLMASHDAVNRYNAVNGLRRAVVLPAADQQIPPTPPVVPPPPPPAATKADSAAESPTKKPSAPK